MLFKIEIEREKKIFRNTFTYKHENIDEKGRKKIEVIKAKEKRAESREEIFMKIFWRNFIEFR